MNDEPIWAHESPSTSTEVVDNGKTLRLELTTGRGPTVWTDLEPGDVAELWEALGDWLRAQ